jgi:hypothetical protein
MTTVQINPGVCGFVTRVEATSEDEQMVSLKISSGCQGIRKMAEKLNGEIDSFEACLCKPGEGAVYESAQESCPGHAACPVIAGILKCMEVECKLALPKDAEIKFLS